MASLFPDLTARKQREHHHAWADQMRSQTSILYSSVQPQSKAKNKQVSFHPIKFLNPLSFTCTFFFFFSPFGHPFDHLCFAVFFFLFSNSFLLSPVAVAWQCGRWRSSTTVCRWWSLYFTNECSRPWPWLRNRHTAPNIVLFRDSRRDDQWTPPTGIQ
jgi:hypothetical protein